MLFGPWRNALFIGVNQLAITLRLRLNRRYAPINKSRLNGQILKSLRVIIRMSSYMCEFSQPRHLIDNLLVCRFEFGRLLLRGSDSLKLAFVRNNTTLFFIQKFDCFKLLLVINCNDYYFLMFAKKCLNFVKRPFIWVWYSILQEMGQWNP